MSKNKKSIKKSADNLNLLAQQLGMTLMAAAATLGMVEMPTHPNNRIVMPNQPVFAFANLEEDFNNPIKREQEETAPHYISYNVSQRTPARSAKH